MVIPSTIKESLFLAVAILALAPSIRSHGATIVPDEDTFITTHTGLGGPASAHPSDAALYAIGQTSFTSHTLLHFDLSAFTGQTAIGDATLSLFVSSVFGLTPARTVSVHEVLTNWSAATVTYNNFGPMPGMQIGSDVSAQIAVRTIGAAGMTAQYVTWTIPASLIQNWIDNPAGNRGILINNQSTANQRDLVFGSVEAANTPLLAFIVPEPAMGSLLLFGAIVLMGLRRN